MPNHVLRKIDLMSNVCVIKNKRACKQYRQYQSISKNDQTNVRISYDTPITVILLRS